MSAGSLKGMQQKFWSRLVGVRGSVNVFSDQSSTTTTGKPSNFGTIYQPQKASISEEIAKNKLVFLGEIHSMPPIIAFQRQVQAAMVAKAKTLHVVMEHFSFELQDLLDEFCQGKISFEELVEKYHERGEEGHELEAYQDLLEDAKAFGVRLHAGFLPRKYARMLLKEGPETTMNAVSSWIPPFRFKQLEGTSFHYNVFESLLSGRSIYDPQLQPSDQFRRIFQAQVLKDGAMAQKVNALIKQSSPYTSHEEGKDHEEKFLVVAGNGHLLHYCGVPERVLEENPDLASETCLVISESADAKSFDPNMVSDALMDRFGKEGSNPADFVYLYEAPPGIWGLDDQDERVKDETREAYDRVGESATLPGNLRKAEWIMKSMGYTDEQFAVVGADDAFNFQGVGNPHIHAKIQPRERVLDVGSGLGIDSFIAAKATGPDGAVVGIDISSKEVRHASSRAAENGHNVRFATADMEKIPLPDECIDVVISNGAFCLAPNKRKAFQELFRVLKPGGRISICTTTTQVDHLEEGVTWPLCMRMFIAKKELEPMCKEIGFVDILIDDTDSSMTMEIPEDVLNEGTNPDRNRVHVGGEDFKHLEDFDMDKICARVCVVAKKPIQATSDASETGGAISSKENSS